MDEKTINKVMEEVAFLYEEEPWLRVNEFYIHRDDSVCVHFAVFGCAAAYYVQKIADRYGVLWVIFPHLSIENDVCVNFHGGN